MELDYNDAQGNIPVDGGSLQIKDVQGDIFADDSTKVFDSAPQTFTGKFEGELVGTVAPDDPNCFNRRCSRYNLMQVR